MGEAQRGMEASSGAAAATLERVEWASPLGPSGDGPRYCVRLLGQALGDSQVGGARYVLPRTGGRSPEGWLQALEPGAEATELGLHAGERRVSPSGNPRSTICYSMYAVALFSSRDEAEAAGRAAVRGHQAYEVIDADAERLAAGVEVALERARGVGGTYSVGEAVRPRPPVETEGLGWRIEATEGMYYAEMGRIGEPYWSWTLSLGERRLSAPYNERHPSRESALAQAHLCLRYEIVMREVGPGPLDRTRYEAGCAILGVEPQPDSELGYGRYYAGSLLEYGELHAEMTLRMRRSYAIDDERKERERAAGLERDDGLDVGPRKQCRVCKTLEGNFTTIAGGDVCDDCV